MNWNRRWYCCLGLAALVLLGTLTGLPGGVRTALGQTGPANPCPPGNSGNAACACNNSPGGSMASPTPCGGALIPGGGANGGGEGANYPNVNGSASALLGSLTGSGCDSTAVSAAVNNFLLNNPSDAQDLQAFLGQLPASCSAANTGAVGNAALAAFLSSGGAGGTNLNAGTAETLVAGLNNAGVADSSILAAVNANGGSAELAAFLGLFPCSDPIWQAAAPYGLTCPGGS